MAWSAVQYTKFEDERTRPVRDLLAQIPGEVATAVDIGCGPGNSTEVLVQKYPNAAVRGIDSSPEMIEAARKRLAHVDFAVADIATFMVERPVDLVFANAALQWVPDHAALLPFLLAKLSPGGSLAVQVPDNLSEPAHVLMREVAADGPWADKLSGAGRAVDSHHTADWYFETLRDAGAAVNIWRTTYFHLLPGGAAAVVEWFKGSALRPLLARLDPAENAAFETRYQAAIARAYKALPDGSVLLPFPRLFFVATR